jgi:hypothetical protein
MGILGVSDRAAPQPAHRVICECERPADVARRFGVARSGVYRMRDAGDGRAAAASPR